MDAYQENLNQLMQTFGQRMDSFEDRQASMPGTPENENLAAEFATFKTFVFASFRALQNQIELMAKQADQQEMRGRRKILLLHGISEEHKENTLAVVVKNLAERLKLTGLTANDICRCNRMGRASNADKPRPILFELCDEATRGKIWAAKTSLKGSGVTMSEFLTKNRRDVYMAARQQFGVTKCWTGNGYIFVIAADGSRHRISSISELAKIAPASKETGKPSTATKKTATPTAPAAPGAAPKVRRVAATKK